MPKLTAVLCVLNSQYIHSSLAPWCLLAGTEAYCSREISACVVEGTVNEPVEQAAQRIIDQKPQVIGLSCYIWNIMQNRKLIRLIKDKLPDAVIVLGGPEVSYHAEEVLRQEPLVQYVISGEGEKPFALLLNAIQAGEEPKNIPGLCYRQNGEVVVSAPYTPQEEPPSPYTEQYFKALNGRIAYFESSRGCPYSCAFCLSGRCGGARFFELERTKKELLLLANSGTQTVKFVDRTFNANRKRAVDLIRFILQNYGTAIPKGVCFHFEVAGDLLDEETLELLKEAPVGSIQLEIGLQSFNERTLNAIHRKTDVERLKRNILRLTENANMHIHIDLIAGLPYEGWESFAESFNTAYGLHPNMLQLGFLKLLYGAAMREQPEEFPCSYAQQPPYEVLETPYLSRDELLRLHHTEDALERLYNSGRFRRTMDYLLQQVDFTPFELFTQFGDFTAQRGTAGISLDDYNALVFEYFTSLNSVDPVVLRDRMVCDRIATNSSGKLPPVLRVKDNTLKTAILKLEQEERNRPQKGMRRGYALLRSEHCLIYADYCNRNPITGEYPLHRYAL